MRIPSLFQGSYRKRYARGSNVPLRLGHFRDTSSGAKRQAGQKISKAIRDFGGVITDHAQRMSSLQEKRNIRGLAHSEVVRWKSLLMENSFEWAPEQTFKELNSHMESIIKDNGLGGSTADEFRTIFMKGTGAFSLDLASKQATWKGEKEFNTSFNESIKSFRDGSLTTEDFVKNTFEDIETVAGGDKDQSDRLYKNSRGMIQNSVFNKIVERSDFSIEKMVLGFLNPANPSYEKQSFEAELNESLEKLNRLRLDDQQRLRHELDILQKNGLTVDRQSYREKLDKNYDRKEKILRRAKEDALEMRVDRKNIFTELLKTQSFLLGASEIPIFKNVSEAKRFSGNQNNFAQNYSEQTIPLYQRGSKHLDENGSRAYQAGIDRHHRQIFEIGVHNGSGEDGDFIIYPGAPSVPQTLLKKLANVSPLNGQPNLRRAFLNPEHPDHSEVMKYLRDNYKLIEEQGDNPGDPVMYKARYKNVAQALKEHGYSSTYHEALLSRVDPDDKANLRREFNSAQDVYSNDKMKSLRRGVADGSITPGEAIAQARKIPGLSFSQIKAQEDQLNEIAGEASDLIQRFHSEHGKDFQKFFLTTIQSTGLPNPSGIYYKEEYNRKLAQRIKNEYEIFKNRDRSGKQVTLEEWFLSMSLGLRREIASGQFRVNSDGSDIFTIPSPMDQLVEGASRLQDKVLPGEVSISSPRNVSLDELEKQAQEAEAVYTKSQSPEDLQKLKRILELYKVVYNSQELNKEDEKVMETKSGR